MTYKCEDSLVLFLANIDEQPKPADTDFTICDYNESWFINLLDSDKSYGLTSVWTQNAGLASAEKEPIIESIPIVIGGSGDSVVDRRIIQDKFLQAVRRWQENGYRNNSVWLYHMISGESGLRRAFIHQISLSDTIRQYLDGSNSMWMYQTVNILRHFVWESVEVTDINLGEVIATGAIDVGTTFSSGSEQGRICVMHLDDLTSDFGNRILSHVWVGFKENIGCGIGSWGSLMPLFLGFYFEDTMTIFDPFVVFASGLARVGFAGLNGEEHIPRVGVELVRCFPGLTRQQYNQWRGRYIVLLRARISGSTTRTRVTVSMRYGWRTTRLKIFGGSPIEIDTDVDGEVFRMWDMGIVECPPDVGRACASDDNEYNIGEFSIGVSAGRLSGDGSLDLDSFVLIPYDNFAFGSMQNFDSEWANFGFETNAVRMHTHEDDTFTGRYITTVPTNNVFDSADNDMSFVSNNFYLPERGARMVICVQYYDVTFGLIRHDPQLDDTYMRTNVRMQVYERWLSYRN